MNCADLFRSKLEKNICFMVANNGVRAALSYTQLYNYSDITTNSG